jgi:transposase
MEKISVMGIDLAKQVFFVYAADRNGKKLVSKEFRRRDLFRFVSGLPKCLIGMEACASAHYWAREFQKIGHEVRLMAPQFVKPYVKSNKNDAKDAEAIWEAVTRPNMRFVPIKQTWQQDIQSIHRVRNRWLKSRTALLNEIHGLLGEYGIVVSRLPKRLLKELAELVSPESGELAIEMKQLLSTMSEELKQLENYRETCDERLKKLSIRYEACTRLETIPGVGTITATAVIAAVSQPELFKSGREFAAWLGLVPRQSSSGGKPQLLGISKRGDSYIRCLLVHGARSAIIHAGKKTDRLSLWAMKKKESRGGNRAAVALANKNARIIWALMTSGETFRAVA